MKKEKHKNYKKDKMRRLLLLGNIIFEYLSKDTFKEFIEELEAEDIANISKTLYNKERKNIWNQIQACL